VYTPTLTGLGERRHLAHRGITLATHVEDVVNVYAFEDLEHTVLVGHSYGGMVITGVAGRIPHRIAHLVYLDAFVPQPGESLFDLLPPEVAARTREGVEDGWLLPYPSRPDAPLYGVTDPDDVAWLRSKLVPQPLGTFSEGVNYTEPLEGQAFTRTYIVARAAIIFRVFADRVRDNPAWRSLEIDTGHDIMVTEPEALSRHLLDLVV
jgi:pimeloyl-ACP methyl ester carboxylesterase